ncbi:uncharacterized protein LOC128677048 isoform X3 [Plodia interpunctella]|uniref:uncharacterized protein LOC128677048 isoform X3 n=1 Tax=Plodia interpunctella TaxID=58824 RepID=UPI002367C31E|nr:uncharacterized protein LOC128677048 isoform X3 [Plodia interpunctella]
MGRKKRNRVYEYYEYDEVSKTSKCLIDGCTALLKGQHGANLLRHFYFRHKKLYKSIRESNRENAKKLKNTNSSKEKLYGTLIELNTLYEGLFDDAAFRNILDMIPAARNSMDEIKDLVNGNTVVKQGPSPTMSQENNRFSPEPEDMSTLNDHERPEDGTHDPDDTMSINNFGNQELPVHFDSVESCHVKSKRDPLDDKASDSHSTLDSSESEDCAPPVQKEILTQRSRGMVRRRSDVVRKNIAIAEYYETKKMKVLLEIKKLQLEIEHKYADEKDKGEQHRHSRHQNGSL